MVEFLHSHSTGLSAFPASFLVFSSSFSFSFIFFSFSFLFLFSFPFFFLFILFGFRRFQRLLIFGWVSFSYRTAPPNPRGKFCFQISVEPCFRARFYIFFANSQRVRTTKIRRKKLFSLLFWFFRWVLQNGWVSPFPFHWAFSVSSAFLGFCLPFCRSIFGFFLFLSYRTTEPARKILFSNFSGTLFPRAFLHFFCQFSTRPHHQNSAEKTFFVVILVF